MHISCMLSDMLVLPVYLWRNILEYAVPMQDECGNGFANSKTAEATITRIKQLASVCKSWKNAMISIKHVFHLSILSPNWLYFNLSRLEADRFSKNCVPWFSSKRWQLVMMPTPNVRKELLVQKVLDCFLLPERYAFDEIALSWFSNQKTLSLLIKYLNEIHNADNSKRVYFRTFRIDDSVQALRSVETEIRALYSILKKMSCGEFAMTHPILCTECQNVDFEYNRYRVLKSINCENCQGDIEILSMCIHCVNPCRCFIKSDYYNWEKTCGAYLCDSCSKQLGTKWTSQHHSYESIAEGYDSEDSDDSDNIM